MPDQNDPLRENEARLLAAIRELDAHPEPLPSDDPLETREAEVMNKLRSGPEEALVDIRVSRRHPIPVIHVEGELDLFTAERFRECLRVQLAETNGKVIVDLSGMAYIDSTGLGILLQAARRSSGNLCVVSPRERITRLFRIAGITGELSIYASLPDALVGLDVK